MSTQGEPLDGEVLAELAAGLVNATTADSGLDAVSQLARATIPSCDHAGLTIITDEGLVTRGATAPLVLEVDAAQYENGLGPCVQSATEGTVVRCEDVYSERRWPLFVRHAKSLGIGSTISFPLVLAGDGLGALNCYSGRIGAFGEEDARLGELLAKQAALILHGTVRYWQAQETIRQLTEAVQSRQLIGQAVGIVMAREHLSSDAAFAWLKEQSQLQNRKVALIAAEIVAAVES